MSRRQFLLPVGILALPFLFLWKLLLTNRILVGLDAFNYFYPYHDFAAAELLAGRLPLWNPHLFLGVPFLADSQSQLLYPLNWPLFWLDAPRALNLSIAIHLAIAALGCWLLARRALRMASAGAWVVSVVFALSGYLGSQAEHPNQLAAASWLPWLLLGASIARRRPDRGMLLIAVALALSLLAGHAQTTFISLVALALWWLLAVRPVTGGVRLMLVLAIGGLLGLSLAAIQLVPMAELSRLSIRADGLTYREAVSFSFDPRLWPRALLPTFGRDTRVSSEYIAYLGFSGVLLALLGLIFPRRRSEWYWALGLAGLGLFLAPAIVNPVYPLLWRFVPGIALFRAPARWLLLYVLGMSVLAGMGADWLLTRSRPLARPDWYRLGAALVALGTAAAASLIVADLPPRAVWPWWIAALLASGLLLLMPRFRVGARLPLLALILVGELFVASGGLDYNKATAPEAYSALRPAPAHLLADQPPRGWPRLLARSDLTWDPGDLADLESRHAGLLGPEAIYDLVVATKLKEVLAPNQPLRWGLSTVDGYGGGLLPLRNYTTLQSLLPLTKIVPDGRLRERLTAVPERRWLDILGVEWVVADKVDDLWIEGVYHDLGLARRLETGETLSWGVEPAFPADGLSLIAATPLPEGPVAQVRVDGRDWVTIESGDFEAARDHWARAQLHFSPSAMVTAIEVRVPEGSAAWTLGGLTLTHSRLPAFEALPADPGFRTALSGDVKVYRRVDAPGRAWAVPSAREVPDEELSVALSSPAFDPRRELFLSASPQEGRSEVLSSGPPLEEATVEWVSESPTDLRLKVTTDGAGWLVLADNWYPGWTAMVDGRPVAIEQANLFARAVPIPGPGSHNVHFRYRPRSLVLGAALTGLGLAAVAALAWRASKDKPGVVSVTSTR